MTSPLDELVKRIEHLERRMARIEALAGIGKSNVEEGAELRVAIERARSQTNTTAAGSSSVSQEMRAVLPPHGSDAQGSAQASTATSAANAPPPTLRLAPIPPREPSDSLPDLSLLDEKVERRKGPAQKIDVVCALEEYPRICARVQQLWGTAVAHVGGVPFRLRDDGVVRRFAVDACEVALALAVVVDEFAVPDDAEVGDVADDMRSAVRCPGG